MQKLRIEEEKAARLEEEASKKADELKQKEIVSFKRTTTTN